MMSADTIRVGPQALYGSSERIYAKQLQKVIARNKEHVRSCTLPSLYIDALRPLRHHLVY